MKPCAVEIRRACMDSEEAFPHTRHCVFVPDQGFVPNAQGQLLHANRTAALEAAYAHSAHPGGSTYCSARSPI